MTNTRQEDILDYVATELAATAGAAGRVYRSRTEAYSRDESPAVSVEPGLDSAASQPVSTCYIDWTFQLVIAVFSRGQHGIGRPSADQVADPVIHSVHSLLMADRSLGGHAIDVWPVSRDPQLVSAEDPSIVTVLTYRVRYRTGVADLSISGH
jgi:hypothetical protein